jgi:hypothetical protein
MTPGINYRNSSPACKKAWFTFKDNHRGEELSAFSFTAGWNARAGASVTPDNGAKELAAALEEIVDFSVDDWTDAVRWMASPQAQKLERARAALKKFKSETK